MRYKKVVFGFEKAKKFVVEQSREKIEIIP